MNNEKQLKDLQKTIDDAQKQIQELMDQKDDFEFSGGRYYVTGFGKVHALCSPTTLLPAGNEFESSEFAEYAAKMKLRQNIMLKAAERFNPKDWRPDFSKYIDKFTIFYNYEDEAYGVGSADISSNLVSIFFSTREIAEAAIPFIKYHMEKLDK
jgi:hypothetical protein